MHSELVLLKKMRLKALTITERGCNILAPMSRTLPLTIDPWLLYRRNETVEGDLSLCSMPHLLASQNRKDGVAWAKIAVLQREDGQVVITGEATVDVNLTCQRCLQPLDELLVAHFELVLVKYERQLSSVSDSDDAIVCADTLELAPLIEQELILALPMIAKHDNCQAAYTNEVSETADTQQPFANLKDLLK